MVKFELESTLKENFIGKLSQQDIWGGAEMSKYTDNRL